MKTILITGGNGFIGTNLSEKLLNEQNRVISVDNLFSSDIRNMGHLVGYKNFSFINHDINDVLSIEEDIDEIYHLACPASPKYYQKDPIYTMKTNFIGTLNILELARIKNCKILLTSTSEIYGEPEITPQSENYRGNVNTIGPRSCYDEGKRIAETLMIEYHNKYNTDIRIARVFNTYGPYMNKDDGRVIVNFINQMLENKDITVYGDGNQTRSFCYIDDLINGLSKLMSSTYRLPMNIGNINEISINELVYKLRILLDSTSAIINLDIPIDDPTNRRPDIWKAKNYLGWEPKIDIEEGLLKTIPWYKK